MKSEKSDRSSKLQKKFIGAFFALIDPATGDDTGDVL